MQLIDGHCHLLPFFMDKKFRSTHGEEISLQIFVNSETPSDWQNILKLDNSIFKKFIGLHPWACTENWEQDVSRLKTLVRGHDGKTSCHGIGEIGLDAKCYRQNKIFQERALHFQLALADEAKLPVSLHCVKAWGKLFDSLARFTNIPAVLLHGFMGPLEIFKEAVKRGYYFGINPQNISAGISDNFSLKNILIETDAVQKRFNQPSAYLEALQNSYRVFAGQANCTMQELSGIMQANAAVFTSCTDSRK